VKEVRSSRALEIMNTNLTYLLAIKEIISDDRAGLSKVITRFQDRDHINIKRLYLNTSPNNSLVMDLDPDFQQGTTSILILIRECSRTRELLAKKRYFLKNWRQTGQNRKRFNSDGKDTRTRRILTYHGA
jgi:hypothetical protein